MKTIDGFCAMTVLTACFTANAEQPAIPASAQEVTALLEKRWPQKAIEDFCTPERRWNPLDQNLVPDGDKFWQGVLYEGKPTTFDKIDWYAGVKQNKIEYSLNAWRGNGHWCLEIGNEKTLRQPLKRPVER
jgi:hypothetical protein